MSVVQFKRLSEKSVLPKYQTSGAAGFDFHCVLDNPLTIPAKTQAIVKTGLAVVLPDNTELQIRPRSGLAAKYSITVTNSPGTVDSDYRNEIMIILFNLGDKDFVVNPGDRIAQGVINQVNQYEIIEIQNFSEDSKKNDRGGGLGSTGV